MLVVGLTGGIGSGKTTVAHLFAQQRISILEADAISHELIQPKAIAYQKILDFWGESIIDRRGYIDRMRLRKIIFLDPIKRQWLESLLHPLIRIAIIERMQHFSSPYCIIVIPLLLENKGMYPFIQRVLVVDALEETQIQRVIQRDHVSISEVKMILATQLCRIERLAAAQDIIFNEIPLPALKTQVWVLHQQYLGLARRLIINQ